MISILKWLISRSLKVIYTQISHNRHFSHSYLDMQGFVVIILILKIDVKFLQEVFSANKLTWQFKKICFHYKELLNKYQKYYLEILSEIFG